MAVNSSIEWTESTWNPVTGCTKISAGCDHCYAERMARRLHGMGNVRYRNGFSVTLHRDKLPLPLSWREPQTILVNSMSDLFHRGVPTEFIHEVFRVMSEAPHHRFQVLTKRSRRMAELGAKLAWPANVWAGVTVEDEACRFRMEHLRRVPAQVKFLSLEPLLTALPDLDLGGIDWVIVGGESGPGARPMRVEWVTDIRDQCLAAGVPFFFKQWGGVAKKRAGRKLDGRTWDEMPALAGAVG
jgi:protein gp37